MSSVNEWPMVKLGELGRFVSGGTPNRKRPEFYEGSIPWISSADISDTGEISTRRFITEEAITSSATKLVPAHTMLIATRIGVGKVAITSEDLCFSQDIVALIDLDETVVSSSFLKHMILITRPYLQGIARGVTIKGISISDLQRLEIPLPPLAEQQRISEILDHVQSLQVSSQKQLSTLPYLRESLFNKHFGDLATNPHDFPLIPLGDLSTIFSDGPFGSNLKSSHYTPDGVRVIRLQNIGVGEFIDQDKAFISEEHFHSLHKHECLPGDIVVGTLGEPNLRACLVPEEITPAINKADCVQIRVDESKAHVAWMCQLLNMPGTLRLARALVKGQTRARIAMGRLRKLEVPVPPLHLQEEFALQLEAVQKQEIFAKKRQEKLHTLTTSLQSRAFTSQL